jgi:hypothetical protein
MLAKVAIENRGAEGGWADGGRGNEANRETLPTDTSCGASSPERLSETQNAQNR